MPLPKHNAYTIEDIYALPDGQRAELIDGQIYDMAPPSRIHQKISTQLVSCINHYISEHHGNCEVYAAPFAVFLNKDNKNYVEPDVSVICDPDKLDDKGCNGAPDWIIEIVSPSSQHLDYLTKLLKYRTAGVREYFGNAFILVIRSKCLTNFAHQNRINLMIDEAIYFKNGFAESLTLGSYLFL